MIFDGVVGTAVKHFRYFCPFVIELSVFQKENPFFFFAPANLLYFRIQMIMPTLSALLSSPILKMLGNFGPLLRPVLFDEL